MNTTPSTVQCPNCKQNNLSTQTHCDFCGQRLSSAASPPNAQVTANTVTPLPAPLPASALAPAPLSQPASRHRLLIGIAVIMVLIVTAAVSIKIFKSSKSEAPVTEPTNVIIKREPTAPSASTSAQSDIAASSEPQAPAVATTDVNADANSVMHTITFRVRGEPSFSPGRARIAGESPERFSPGKGGAIGPPQIASITTTPATRKVTPQPGGSPFDNLIERLPWSATITAQDARVALTASTKDSWVSAYGAKNGLSFYGRLIAEIEVDGRVVARDVMQSGEVGSVQCSAVVGQDPRTPEAAEAENRAEARQERQERIALLRADIIVLQRRKERILLDPNMTESSKRGLITPIDEQLADKQKSLAVLSAQ